MFAGLQKTSLIDYPGKVSCVAFFSGCNLHCPYCHNADLARGKVTGCIRLEELLDFLAPRKALIDGVVLSGGEPTLQPDLEEVCRALRALGLAVKLDTNGLRPRVLERLFSEGLIDYVAMDLKTVPDRYAPMLADEDVGLPLARSIHLIMQSGVAYEFRTTCVRPLVDETLIDAMAAAIAQARLYVLQSFRSGDLLDPSFSDGDPGFARPAMERLREVAAGRVEKCLLRE
jgi:pyruvate formate lyase activating enzyme